MHSKYDKVALFIAIVEEAIIIISAFTNVLQNNLDNLKLYILASVCIAIPFIISYIASKKKLIIPKSFNIVSVLFIFAAQYLGEIHNYYIKYMWWDLLLHAVFGLYAVIVSLHFIKGLIRREIDIFKNRFTMFSSIIAFCFAVTLGTIWELFEFSGDFIFKTGMVKGGLQDTATDLLVKVCAAFISSSYYYIKNRE